MSIVISALLIQVNSRTDLPIASINFKDKAGQLVLLQTVARRQRVALDRKANAIKTTKRVS